ncbi:MAG: F0F1 ATP synthase subunit delta [Alcaligenaceae bacterium]|jgi:F-type H+-transporting ATPase subunit delta|nr:F0F1 ATP synthase subunit delta [Alcaligenaceae bacterium]
MAELSTIARPYAAAAFAAALDSQVGLETWAKAVKQLSEVVSVPDVKKVLSDPKITKAESVAVFDTVLPNMPADVKNFVQLIVENNRWKVLPEIAEQFLQLKNKHEGKAIAQITSAFELTQEQLKELLTGLEKKFSVTLEPEVKVDPALIGGVRVIVGDQVLDTSVQAQIARLHDKLVAE